MTRAGKKPALYVTVEARRLKLGFPLLQSPHKLCSQTEPNPCCKPHHLRPLRSHKTMSGRLTQCASKTGVGTTRLVLCSTVALQGDMSLQLRTTKGCEEKHSNTTAHHPVVKPPAAASHGSVAHSSDTTGFGKLPGTIL